MKGQPLWFLGVLVAGWAAVRIVVLWPDSLAAISAPVPARSMPAPAASPAAAGIKHSAVAHLDFVAAASSVVARANRRPAADGSVLRSVSLRAAFPPALPDPPAASFRSEPITAIEGVSLAPGLPPVLAASRSRWSGSAWAIARDGGAGALLSPLLGGSQAGVRVVYALDRAGRTGVFARAATPLSRGPAEVALGAQWRPGRVPVTAFAEARASDGRIAPVAGLYGGGAVALGRFRMDGYGQAGVIARGGAEAFGDGQLRLVRRFGRIEAGAGVWGAAQRGAARLDVGPSVSLQVPADLLAVRLTLDWRQRVAGNARPASGPALSLGADF